MPDPERLARQRLRSRIEAAALDAMSSDVHRLHGQRKAEVIGAMSGTVVELGPGTGVNMRYYAPGTHVIGIEPNVHMHERLRKAATEHRVDLEVRTIVGESVDLPDASADGVVGTLVLCGVDDQDAVLSEVRRMLRSGGTYFFLEHVVAPEGSINRRVQQLMKRPHRWAANGCEVDRDTAAAIRRAGFGSVDMASTDTVAQNLYVRHQIIGTAVR